MTSISCLVRGAIFYLVVEGHYSPVRLTFDPELGTTYDDIGHLIQPSQSHSLSFSLSSATSTYY